MAARSHPRSRRASAARTRRHRERACANPTAHRPGGCSRSCSGRHRAGAGAVASRRRTTRRRGRLHRGIQILRWHIAATGHAMSVVALASKTLFYEWRKFLPAALAVAFSGLLLLMQSALMFGIFDSASVYVNKSAADLWAGYP